MKHRNTLTILLGLGALLPLAASPLTPEDRYVHSSQKAGAPVPISVVAPDVQGFDVGKSARVEFVVDSSGYASDFTVVSTNDPGLADAVIDAVRQWRFDPARQNGLPVATRVVLPVHIDAATPATMFEVN